MMQHPYSVVSSNPARFVPQNSGENIARPFAVRKRKACVLSVTPDKNINHYDDPSERSTPTGVIVNDHTKEEPPDDYMDTIKRNLEAAKKDNAERSWSKVSIYKIPDYLVDPSNHKAFIPQAVSLGPYHHGKTPILQQMERHKWRALQRVLERTQRDIKHYLDPVKELEIEARACYAALRKEKPDSNEFVEMMLLDGCFILEILQGATEPGGFKELGYVQDDPVFSMRGAMNFIKRDMIMLENQIPLFVLDKLYGVQKGNIFQKDGVAKLAISFSGPFIWVSPPADHLSEQTEWCVQLRPCSRPQRLPCPFLGPCEPPSVQGNLHCLDVFRKSLLYEQTDPQDPSVTIQMAKQQLIHCVTELKDAGIKFRKPKTTVCKLRDIKFENGILYIPPIMIDDGTKSLLFNLMAFEHCHLIFRKDITTYVIFLDNLINTAEDVKYLRKHGIIEHWLGSDAEVADLINCLGKEVVFNNSDSYLSQVSQDINKYYNRAWNTWRATLKEKYFNNPWSIISSVAAVLLLLLTAAQAIYAVYSYYWPNN